MPQKPKIIIAHVEGSGTAVTAVIVPVNAPSPVKVTWVTNAVELAGSRPKLGSIPNISNLPMPLEPKLNNVLAARSCANTKDVPFHK